MVTLKDVAQKAGVSTQLVSIVANGKSKQLRVSATTTQRIEALLEEMGYDNEKGYSARRMVARRSGHIIASDVIAVCMAAHNVETDVPNSDQKKKGQPVPLGDLAFVSDILHGIERAAFEVGLDVLICRHSNNDLPKLLARQEVDGVIMLSVSEQIANKIAYLDVPTVNLVDEQVNGKTPFSNLSVDNQKGIAMAVEHLAQLGHKNIAYLGHPKKQETGKYYSAPVERLSTFQGTMKKCGIGPPYMISTLISQNFETSSLAAQQLWRQSKGTLTAIVCYNDIFAMGAIRGLEGCGVRVPHDVSVTGFDDISEQFAFTPTVTSLYYDRFQMGQRAVELLWRSRSDWLEGKGARLTSEIVPVKLMTRDSTAQAPSPK